MSLTSNTETECNAWRSALRRFTPAGDDFNEPVQCVEHVQGRLDDAEAEILALRTFILRVADDGSLDTRMLCRAETEMIANIRAVTTDAGHVKDRIQSAEAERDTLRAFIERWLKLIMCDPAALMTVDLGPEATSQDFLALFVQEAAAALESSGRAQGQSTLKMALEKIREQIATVQHKRDTVAPAWLWLAIIAIEKILNDAIGKPEGAAEEQTDTDGGSGS